MESIQQHIDNLLNSKIGKVTNNTTLENMSRRGIFKGDTTAARKANETPIQLIKDDVVVYEFESQHEAATFLGVHSKTISATVSGRYKTCKGYIVKKK